ncbi:MAG: peptidylprolyl isomerase [Promicromonosporaceae bacterium]|nr:peptidylprolyl isomerase [Promicromonosporaceae bacterium]
MAANKRDIARQKEARREAAYQAAQARRQRRHRVIALVVAGAMLLGVAAGVIIAIATGGGNHTAGPDTSGVVGFPEDENTAPPEQPTAPAEAPNEPVATGPEAPDPALAEGRTWTATIQTSVGPIDLELYGAEAPQAVASFIHLAQAGFFNQSPCHRLTTAGIFVLQCGDPTGTGMGGPEYSFGPIENAPADDFYPVGTLAMARRGGDGHSMGSQFFLVWEDSFIPSDMAGGYTVFGRITSGLDIVQAVADAGVEGGGPDGQPAIPVTITGVEVQ